MLKPSLLNDAQSSAKLTLHSNPYLKRTGLLPLTAALTFGWIFVVAWALVTAFTFSFNSYWASVLGGSTLAFACILGYMSYKIVLDGFQDFILELTDSECVLITYDRLRKKRSTSMILLDDVTYAEYYPYSDSSLIILHAPYYQMEVPLWPMGERGKDVMDFLAGRGVRIVDVQSDAPVPELPH